MKNICIFTNTLLSGGAEKQAILLAKALNEKYNVWLVVYYGEKVERKFLEILKNNNIQTVYLYDSHFQRIIKFYSFLRNNKIEIIFSYLLTTNLIGGLIGLLAGVKFRIGGIRNSKLEGKKEILQKFLHNYINYHSIFNNYRGYEFFINKGFNPKKSVVIPNCFELTTKPFKREISDKVIILSVGRFHEAKDYRTAIQAVSKIRSTFKKFKYQIIGYGELENDIVNWINEVSANDYIELIINPNNLQYYYEKADIYLMTSTFEGLSNTVLEAMSYSLPLVLTDVGDNNILVEDNCNGFLCEVKNIHMISNRLKILIEDNKKRIEFGLNSFQKLKMNYSYEKFHNDYIHFIEKLGE